MSSRLQLLAALGLNLLLAGAAPPAAAAPPIDRVALVPVASGLSRPLLVTHAGDGSGRTFLVEQTGAIRILVAGSVLPTPFLDLGSSGEDLIACCGERGLLGLAFHPAYAVNGRFFVNYTRKADGATVVARYQVSGTDRDVADPSSALQLYVLPQPETNHNGGHLAFGPDGLLYVASGDGGGGGDPLEAAQRLDTLLGKILRLDVDGGTPYAIPASNPFVGVPGAREEIWAFGLRNPWRFSFDRATGDLLIGDVGQGSREEVNRQPAASLGGENYGWDVLEGTACYEDVPAGSCAAALSGGSTLPVLEYTHAGGRCSVTGGHVYRGSTHSSLAGRYLYGDYCTGEVWQSDPTAWSPSLLLDTAYRLASFGEDEAGKLYLADVIGGTVSRLSPYTFADVVPDAFAWSQVETLAAFAITSGCTADLYCPDASVTRAQMAVFLLKTDEGSGYLPPSCQGIFSDVACPSLFADWIEELAVRGITAGCSPSGYCPDDPVTRAQMAVFLLKTVEGAGYSPPACTGVFADVACPSLFADWIEELADRGITAGCSPTDYCPDDPVTRAQMAVFLTTAFGLPVTTP